MGPQTTFFAWLFGTIVVATFGAPREHGSGLMVAVVILCAGTIAGLVHANIIYRRNHASTEHNEARDV